MVLITWLMRLAWQTNSWGTTWLAVVASDYTGDLQRGLIGA